MSIQNKTISIIDEIISSNDYEHCLILTYNSSLAFYEKIILKNLVNSGCYCNAIIMDGSQYEDVINEEVGDIQFCGSKYYSLDPIRVKGVFHPKIILLTSKTKGKVLIGSGNLTVPGYGSSFEMFNKYEYSEDNKEHLPVFKNVKDFIIDLTKRNYLNPATEKRINNILNDTGWIPKDAESSNNLFLHNLDTPLLDQITKQLPQDIDEIVLMAPYFDSKLAVIDKLKKIYSNTKIKIIIQDHTTNFPIKYFIENKTSLPFVSLHKFKADDTSRRLHAKMLYFCNASHEYLFSGSANISSPALIKYANNGNVECGMFINAEKTIGSGISNIWNNHITKEKIEKITDIRVSDISKDYIPSISKNKIQVKGAFIKESILYIDYYSEAKGKVGVIINDVEVIKENINSGEGRIECLLDLTIKEHLSKNTNIICLKMRGDTSNKVWLHNYTIYKPGAENKITGHLNSIGSYIDNIEIAKSIIELTTPFEVKQGYENNIFKGSKLGEQEELEEQVELPEQRYFVEEKSEYQDASTILTRAVANDKYDIFGQLFGGVARQVQDHYKKYVVKEDVSLDKEENKKDKDESPGIEDVKQKLNSLVNRTVDRTVTQINKKDFKLDLSAAMAINQLIASLTWFQNGIKIEFGDEQTNVLMSKKDYIDSSINLLYRMWSDIKEGDFLFNELKEDEYKLISLVNIIALPLCFVLYSLHIIENDDDSFEIIEEKYKELADIFYGIKDFIKKVPEKLLVNVISTEIIKKIYDQLFFINNDFKLPDLSWEELLQEPVSKEKLRESLHFMALKHKRSIQLKMKNELLKIEEASAKLNQELFDNKIEDNSGGSILDLIISEQSVDRLEEEKINAEKIIDTNIKIDKEYGECQLPVNVKKFFNIKY